MKKITLFLTLALVSAPILAGNFNSYDPNGDPNRQAYEQQERMQRQVRQQAYEQKQREQQQHRDYMRDKYQQQQQRDAEWLRRNGNRFPM